MGSQLSQTNLSSNWKWALHLTNSSFRKLVICRWEMSLWKLQRQLKKLNYCRFQTEWVTSRHQVSKIADLIGNKINLHAYRLILKLNTVIQSFLSNIIMFRTTPSLKNNLSRLRHLQLWICNSSKYSPSWLFSSSNKCTCFKSHLNRSKPITTNLKLINHLLSKEVVSYITKSIRVQVKISVRTLLVQTFKDYLVMQEFRLNKCSR